MRNDISVRVFTQNVGKMLYLKKRGNFALIERMAQR